MSSHLRPLLAVVSFFVVSRVVFYWAGVRFYSKSISYFMQFLDPQLLKNNLLESVFYLHHQPPLFNLFLGLVLKAFPSDYALAFNLIYLSLGIVFAISLCLLLLRFGVSSNLSVLLTCVFMAGPSVIAYENFLFYPYPLAVLLCVAALFLHSYVKNERLLDAFVFFSLLAVVVLIRSLYHMAWFLMAVVLLVFYKKSNWRSVLIACSLPLLIVALVYLKHILLFGTFTTSTISGFELAKMTAFQLPADERISLVSQGKLSKVSLIPPYSPVGRYKRLFPFNRTNITVLDQEIKSTGAVNYNHIIYMHVPNGYAEDASYVLTTRPSVYLGSIRTALFRILLVGPCRWEGEGNVVETLDRISPYVRLYDTILLGQVFPYTRDWTSRMGERLYETRASFFWMVISPLLMLFVLVHLSKEYARGMQDAAGFVTLLFMWLTIVYITTVVVTIHMTTVNRYRFPLESFVLVFLGFSLSRLFPVLKRLGKSFLSRMGRPV